MKKILLIILLLCLLFVSCKKKDTNNDEQSKLGPICTDPIEENEDEDPEPEVTKGKLYIQYHLNNDDPDVIEEIKDLDSYSFLEPTKVGYEFVSWCTTDVLNISLRLNNLSMPSDDEDEIVMAYAKWKKEKYDVSFICDGRVVLTRNVEYGSSAKAPNPTVKPGYKFVGWDGDYSYVTSNREIHAVYEEGEPSKKILVVLGNYLNDDGTMSATLRKRLDLAVEAYEEYDPDYIVVTGGKANTNAGITEAAAMYSYLKAKGIPESKIIQEGDSLSTYQNAVYTMQKIQSYDFDTLIIVSTIEHFVNYATVKYFDDAALANEYVKAKNIRIMIYTNNGSY